MIQVDYVGKADARIVRSADMAAAGFTSGDLVWNKANNFEILVNDDLLAAWLLMQDAGLVAQNPTQTAIDIIGKHLGIKPLIFWMHDVAQRIPSGKWVPVAFNNRITTQGTGFDDGIPTGSPVPQTTIAAGSNGLNLPQTSLFVANNAVLKDATATHPEFVVVRNAGVDTIVQYTGKGSGTITGTTGWGDTTTPMVTGDLVRQANVAFFTPGDDAPGTNEGVANAVFDVGWSSNSSGGRWINMAAMDGLGPGTLLYGGGGYCAPVLTPGAPTTTPWVRTFGSEQPGTNLRNQIHVFQNSGALLELPVWQVACPRLVVGVFTDLKV